MWVVTYRKIFYGFSLALVLAGIGCLALWGLKPGIDFTGGTLVEVTYPIERPPQDSVVAGITRIDPAASVRPSGEEGFIVRMKEVSQEEKMDVMDALSLGGTSQLVEKNFASIGPVLGAEALRKSIVSIVLVILSIVLYITFVFRKVSEPVSSWKYGLTAIVALAHDIIIPISVFSVLGHFAGYEVDTLFVTALLVILGFSVHDTIVVFDRVRENLRHLPAQSGGSSGKSFETVVGESVSQTFARSVNTSLTTLLALVILYIFGGEATRHFALVLVIGIAAGTYSSVFIGSPLLVTIEKWGRNGK
jgi:preprotein translocase subunit SecF